MRIGEVAAEAAVNIQTLRYYERVGLLPPPGRRSSGYRMYGPEAVRRVRFIKRAQELGFTLREVKELLKLRSVGPARRPKVRAVAQSKLDDIDQKIRDLSAMRGALAHLVTECATHDGSVTCPILEALEAKPS